jgi:hypothetical protein
MTVHAFDFEIEGEVDDEPQSRIRLLAFDDIKLGTERRYLVKGLIPRTGLVVLWGPPKSGKSFWIFDLIMHVALDWPYRGRRVHPGAVVYCAFEGQAGIEARCTAFRKKFLMDHDEPIPFYLEPVTLDLVKDAPELARTIRHKLGNDLKPAAIVLDTLNRSLRGSESSDEDMSAYIRAANTLREAFDCAVIIVHHCGIDGTRPRGHTSLTGAADAQLAVRRDRAGHIVVTLEHAKDGSEGDTLASRLEVVEVGPDEDGDPITSCVVVPAEGESVRSPVDRKLSDRQRLALAALDECLISHGEQAPPTLGLPANTNTVTIVAWREELFTRGVIEREAKNPREDFRRVRNSLQARTLIGVYGDIVWKA